MESPPRPPAIDRIGFLLILFELLQSCITLLTALFHLLTFDHFKEDRSSTSSEFGKRYEFPLLRLPLVAREHVLCMMTPFELIDLSMTSSSAKRAATIFYIKGHTQEWTYSFRSNRLLFDDFVVFKESKNPIENCMKWFESIKGVLGCRIDKVCVSSPSTSVTDWLQSQQESIEDVSITEGYQKDVKYFLETIKVFGELELEMNPNEGYFQLEIPEDPTHLDIPTSEFIEYDQLLRLKAPFIYLDESFLTNQEINGFLKSWMSCESHIHLKFFKINISGEEAVNEIMNLPHEVITDGYKIRRCDGKEATVRYFWRSMRLLIH